MTPRVFFTLEERSALLYLILFRSVTGSPAYGGSVTNSSTAVQPLERTGKILVDMAAVVEDDLGLAGDSAGDKIKYIITLRNTGTTTLNTITILSAELLTQFERYGAWQGFHRVIVC